MVRLLSAGVEPLHPARLRFARSTEQSKAINRVAGPCVILSASGMATGGRVLHHLARRLPDPRTTVLLVGSKMSSSLLWVRISNCSRDFLSTCGERFTVNRSMRVGSGTGPATRPPVR